MGIIVQKLGRDEKSPPISGWPQLNPHRHRVFPYLFVQLIANLCVCISYLGTAAICTVFSSFRCHNKNQVFLFFEEISPSEVNFFKVSAPHIFLLSFFICVCVVFFRLVNSIYLSHLFKSMSKKEASVAQVIRVAQVARVAPVAKCY